jgi:hypothetical protein
LSNIKNYISDSASNKFKEQIISSLVKDKLTDEHKTKSATLSLIQPNGGQSLTIVVKPTNAEQGSSKQQLLSAKDFLKLQANFNLSQKTTCGIASAIRVATKKRKAVEPNLQKKLSIKIHSLDKYFSILKIDFVKIKCGDSADADELVVYCKDLNGLIQYVKQERQSSEVHLKFGIDGGGGFLKICLSIQSTNNNEKSGSCRQKYEEGIAAKRFKDTGVKKIFILGLAQSSQENYENVSKLWSVINVNDFDGTIATDLKLANILVGIMSHSSLFPCTWCYAMKDKLDECGALRTISNSKEYFTKWSQAGAVKSKAKCFKNCIHPPIVRTTLDKPFLDIIPPPELHLMLGVVNTLFTHMMVDFEKEALTWAKSCNVQREVTHGGTGFKGNACKTLLEKVDILRRDCSLGCLKFARVFQDFRAVVKSCFGQDLDPNFGFYIDSFKQSYLSLNISVTPKVHAVFFHIAEFCNKTQQGLGFFSEQAMESVHFDFNSVWKKYKVSRDHSDYSSRLLRAVCEYNSLRI